MDGVIKIWRAGAGVDPFGECPGNPLEGKGLGSLKANTEFVIERRIRNIEARMHKAEDTVKRTRPSKKALVEKIEALEDETCALRNRLLQIQQLAVY